MKKINLREYYPFYTSDVIVAVPDEIADLLHTCKLKEAADYLRAYRHNALYSLDLNDGIEYSALAVLYQPSPYEILERKRISALLYKGLLTLPEKQRNRIYAHYFLGISQTAIAKAEGISARNVRLSISRGLKSLKNFLEEIL